MKTLNNTKLLESRLKAAQKYFTYHKNDISECTQLPCPVIFDNKPFMSFMNGFSIALTKDRIEMETVKDIDSYPDVSKIMPLIEETKTIDLHSAFAKAKENGYKLIKSEVSDNVTHFFKYGNMYYSIGLTDINFRIIDDGKPQKIQTEAIWCKQGKYPALIIKTSVGYAYILPTIGKYIDFEKSTIINLENVIAK